MELNSPEPLPEKSEGPAAEPEMSSSSKPGIPAEAKPPTLAPPLASTSASTPAAKPTSERPIFGYLMGLAAAFVLALAAIIDGSGVSATASFILTAIGLALLTPALLHSRFWRITSCLVAIIIGVRYGLRIQEAVSHYGLVKQVLTVGGEEMRYGLGDIFDPLGRAFCCVLYASLVSHWDLKGARLSRNFPVLVNGLSSSGLALAAFVLLNFIAHQRSSISDWTSAGLYSISAESKTLVAAMQRPLVMHIFLPEGDPQQALVRRLALQYAAASGGRISIAEHDYRQDRDAFEAEVQRLGLVGSELSDFHCVTFERQARGSGSEPVRDKIKQISTRELFRVRLLGPEASTKEEFQGEQVFTNAILELANDEREARIGFVTGHREHGLEDRGNERGLAFLAGLLRERSFELSELRLSAASEVPDTLDAIVIAGPLTSFSAGELAQIEAYLARGGRVLAFLEAVPADENGLAPESLGGVFEKYGVRVTRHLIYGRVPVRQGNRVGYVPSLDELPFRGLDPEHPITSPLLGGAVVATRARALLLTAPPDSALLPDVEVRPLIVCGAELDSVAVLNPLRFKDQGYRLDKAQDMVENFALAAAARRPKGRDQKRECRLVVVGDSDVAANQNIRLERNLPFILNSLNWILEKEGRFVAEAKTPPTYALSISPQVKIALQLGALFILPAVPLSLAMFAWLLRRS
jgi:hypothetical protein